MPDDVAKLLDALVVTQREFVEALTEVSEDLRAGERRVERLESAAGLETGPARGKRRRSIGQAPDAHDRSV
jgi:hypothetical protein